MQYFTITVANNTLTNQHVSLFQGAARYTVPPCKDPLTAHTNCLYSEVLAPASLGASLNFTSHLRFYAGAQETPVAHPVEGQISAFDMTTQLINLTGDTDPSGKQMPNATSVSLSPFALSEPIVNPHVTPGAFRITTQDFLIGYDVGLAVFVNGVKVMSNYVAAQAHQDIDCGPSLKFHVLIGAYAQGAPIDLGNIPHNFAICDFSTGYRRAVVSLDPVSWGSSDNKWSVKMSA